MSDRTSGYAAAVIAIARSEGQLDAVLDELTQVGSALGASPDLRDVLADGTRPVGQRLMLLESQVLGAASSGTRAAMAMVVAGGAADELPEIVTEVARAVASEQGRELAEVRVAVAIDDTQRAALKAALEAATGRELDLQVVVDPTVVGGVRAIVGDTIIDGSVAHRLDTVRTRIGA
jgi:F-type H+-transporting ATPase subunit delta